MKYLTLSTLASLLLLSSCTHESVSVQDDSLLALIASTAPSGDYHDYILPDHVDLSAIPADDRNPLNAAKVELGMMLFHETGIGGEAFHTAGLNTYSCASCHVANKGFRPGRAQGIADGGLGFGDDGDGRVLNGGYAENQIDAQGIRPLSVLNSAFVSNTLWNGQFGSGGVNTGLEDVWRQFEETQVNDLGFEAIESQNIEGIKLHRMSIDEELITELGYKELFDLAFADVPVSERYDNLSLSHALSAYIRSLTTSRAGFQQYLRGDEDAMTETEIAGATLFFGKAGCARCHNGPNLGSDGFHALGVNDLWQNSDALFTDADDKKNLGRGGFTGRAEDMFKFRVPQLYNLFGNDHFFHGASHPDIESVVRYFNDAEIDNDRVPSDHVSPFFTPLGLTESEISDLTTFIEKALYDHELDRFVPEELPSGNCFPNADFQSLSDLGCQ